MKVTEPDHAAAYAALYKATIEHAMVGATALMARLVAHTRAALREQESQAHDRRERDQLTSSRRLLNQCEANAIERFAEELRSAFARFASREKSLPALSGQPHFDELAGMDAVQVQASVDTARVRHAVQIAADQTLAELNPLICSLLGLAQVRLESNPLRPAVYVDSLTEALSHLPVPGAVRQSWISLMSGALGQELDIYYRQLSIDLRERGVGSIRDMPGTGGAARPSGTTDPAVREVQALTLERLRQLLVHAPGLGADLSGHYGRSSDMSAVDEHDTLLDSGPSAFAPTVPAAFDAVKEMEQLDKVVQRIASQVDVVAQPAQTAREQMRREAHGLDQTLGLEVVTLMIDNIRHDPRLLAPVQDLVARLEPALLQLALVDPRFFSHKQHPARRLLHEITHRSIAYESVDSRGFSGFMEPLHDAVAPLAGSAIDSADLFEQALTRLVAVWDEPEERERRRIARAVQALKRAEQRSALASIMVREVLARPDAVLVPSEILDFLCGPWAQIVAQARMNDRSGADDPGGYAGLIDELMWSAQPAQTRLDPGELARLQPALLRRLEQGLTELDYPPEDSQAFYRVLADLHQRTLDAKAFAETEMADRELPTCVSATASRWAETDSAWLVPAEARASGFIDMAVDPVATRSPALTDQLVNGVWVTLMVDGSWTRTRLAWTSPNASLLLFSDALGFMQSLTRASCEQLFSEGRLRIISSDPVEDALDAVARVALDNSVDIRF